MNTYLTEKDIEPLAETAATIRQEQHKFAILLREFAYHAECQFATLDMYKRRKSTSKTDVRRQQSICDKMILTLRAAGFRSASFDGLPRLRDILATDE